MKIERVCIDNTAVRVHPDVHRSIKKNGIQSIWRTRGGLTTKTHIVAASERASIVFSLLGGNTHDCPEGKKLINLPGLTVRVS
ncbi:MAG: hypothetical protein LBD17_02020 [Endomicrobium sp.]|nr:hypothetical protein [Endomicrobium sp.]